LHPPCPDVSDEPHDSLSRAETANRALPIDDPVGGWLSAACGTIATVLAFAAYLANFAPVWDQPYLETCCRAALHRLHLCGPAGRPSGLMDDPCQRRLATMGLCCLDADGGFRITEAGQRRHATDILKQTERPAATTTAR
jgi:hypothetical protein